MSKKTIAFLVLLIVAPIIVYFLWPSDEARIRKLFREGTKAIEDKKVDDVMKKVSFNYSDDYGFTYLYIREGMERMFQTLDNVKIDYSIKKLEIKENTAAAELEVRVVAHRGNDAGYIVGSLDKPAQMRFVLDKERGNWHVSRTEGLPFNF